uniref:Uncharacterized protein n=1 Tax=Anguilla anguilla TaxID=7936 RepID=A0A0E9VWK3_ANGAN
MLSRYQKGPTKNMQCRKYSPYVLLRESLHTAPEDSVQTPGLSSRTEGPRSRWPPEGTSSDEARHHKHKTTSLKSRASSCMISPINLKF